MKLHLETKQPGEVTRAMVIEAIRRQCGPLVDQAIKIEVRHFAQKNQFKVFVETNDQNAAQ